MFFILIIQQFKIASLIYMKKYQKIRKYLKKFYQILIGKLNIK
jgi:hypothetical protein